MEFTERWTARKKNKRQAGWNKRHMQNTANQGTHHTPVIYNARLKDVVFSNHSKCKEEQFTLLSLEQHDLALM